MPTVGTAVAGGGTSGTTDRTDVATPVVGDLWVIFCTASGNTNVTPTCSDNNGGTYTLVASGLFSSSANAVSCFVRNQLHANTTSTTVTVATGSNTAAEIAIVPVSGMSRAGAAAILQSNVVQNQAAGTPAPAFTSAVQTGNVTLGMVGNATTPATMTPPTSWTELVDVGLSTPSTGLEVIGRNSGFTGTTVTWGSASGSVYAAIIVELDATGNPVSAAEGAPGSEAASVAASLSVGESGAGSDAVSVAVSLSANESGAGSDGASLVASMSAAESGAGSDAATLPLSIAGFGNQGYRQSNVVNIAGTTSFTVSEGAPGSDAASVAASMSAAETGAGSDSASLAASISAAETAPGSDSATVAASLSVAESGGGSDSASVAASLSASEGAPGADAASVSANITAAESGAGSDAVSIQVTVAVGETGAGSDAASVPGSSAFSVGESGAGSDAVSIQVTLSVAQSGAGTDGASVAAAFSIGEAGAGSDASTITAAISAGEGGAGTDASGLVASLRVGESGAGSDAASVAVVLYGTELFPVSESAAGDAVSIGGAGDIVTQGGGIG